MGGLFEQKEKSVTQEPMIPGFQLKTGEALSNWIKQYLPSYQPGAAYGGQFTAGMTPFERTGLGLMGQYMQGANTGDLFGAGRQHLLDTLGLKFARPEDSPYIQAMKRMGQTGLQEGIDTARRKSGARGNFFSTAAMGEEGKLQSKSQDYMNALIGQFIQGERDKAFQAAPIAAQMDEYEMQTAPLKKIGASQTFGSLERMLNQSDLERRYQDYMRQRNELGAVPGMAGGMYGTNVPYGVKTWGQAQPSTFDRLMGAVGTIAPMFGAGGMFGQGGMFGKPF